MDQRILGQPSFGSQGPLSAAHGEAVCRPESGTGEAAISAPAAVQAPTQPYMLAAKRWLVWAADKQPFYVDGTPRRGTLDTEADRNALGTYQQACDAVAGGGGRFVGVGFALGPDGTGGYWQGIDLDDIPPGQLEAWVNELPGYVEVSPSGNGLHAIGYGRQFRTLVKNGSGVEAYAGGRYFTYTGVVRRNEPPTCLAQLVETRVARVHGAPPVAAAETIPVDPKTVTELRSALLHMRSDDYDIWYRMGLALQELGDVGRGLWLEWSATSDKFNAQEASKKWDQLGTPRDTGYRAVFKEAQQQGWINPNSNAARGVEQAAAESIETGEELIARLSVPYDGDEEVDVPDIVEDLVADEEVTLLGGHGGIGKTFLSLQIACAAAMGAPVLHKSARRVRVLYYNAEDGRKRLIRRLRKIVENFDYDMTELMQNLLVVDASDLEPLYGVTSRGKLGPTVDFAKLRAMVEKFDPQLVIVDGASDTFDGNEISRREVRAFIRLLRRLHPERRIGVLINVHIDRSSARGRLTDDDGYSGSTQWHNSARRRLYLQLKADRDDDGNATGEAIVLSVKKNQDGPPAPDMELARGLHGMLQVAVQFQGDLAQQKEDRAKAILTLIDEYYQRGEFMSTSPAANAPTGVFATLKGDPAFPRSLNWKKTTNIVRDLVRAGELVAEEYKTPSRHTRERWRVVHDAQYELPGAQSARSDT